MAVSQTGSASDRDAQLERLLELQDVDVEIMALEDQREEIPKKMKRHDEAVFATRRSLEENDHQIAMIEEELSAKKRLRDLERIRKKNARAKEPAAESAKPYDDFVTEREDGELTGEELDVVLKSLHTRLEELRSAKSRLQTEVEELARARDEGHLALNARQTELDELLDTLYDRRDEMAEGVSEGLLLKYERIAERKDGIAISRVEHGHCLACNMAIPPQLYNQLMKRNQLMTCPACNRILVYTAAAVK